MEEVLAMLLGSKKQAEGAYSPRMMACQRRSPISPVPTLIQ